MSHDNKAFALFAFPILGALASQTSGVTAVALGVAALGIVVWAFWKGEAEREP